MVIRFRTLVLLALLSVAGQLAAATSQAYKKGWDAFLSNDRKNARTAFCEAAGTPDTKADALLSLALLDWAESRTDSAFVHFKSFYHNSPNPYPYLYALFSMSFLFESSGYLPADRVDFLKQIAGDPKMPGTLKTMVFHELGTYYQACNDQKQAASFFSKMGNVGHWQVLGSFDNTSGSGFAKDWGAVTKATPNEVFKNKVDAEVKWYAPPYNKPDNWFYFDYYFYLNNAIMYAQSFVQSPEDQEVYMRTGTSGSLKIWVNDALIASVSEERNCDLDIYGYKIKLHKGANRILVQIGQSEISNANFLLRLTDADGNPVPGLKDEATYTAYSKDKTTTEAEMLPFFAESFLEDKVKNEPGNPLNNIILAETYLRNDKSFEATGILKRLEEAAPVSSLISYRLSEAYQRANNQTDYDKEVENIKRNDPDSFNAFIELYNEAIKSEKYTEAADVCAKAKSLYGENAFTESWELNLASYQKRIDDLISMSKKLYAKYPERYDYMNLNYAIENSKSKNSPTAVSIVEEYCSKFFSTKALETLSGIYIDQGKTDKGLDILKQRIAIMPYATGYIDNLASTCYRMQRYDEALNATDSLLALSPYLPGVYNTRGYIFKAMKNTDKAKENFAKSIYYGPTSYDSRAQLRLLDNKKEVFDLFPKNDLKALIAKAPSAQDYPEDNSVILINDNQIVVYPEAAKEYHYEIAIKILNQSGIESWKEYGIDYNSNTQKLIVDKAEVVKAGGNTVKAETNNNNVVFTNLEVGDVLHLDYRIQDFSTGELAKQFFDQFLFRYNIPSVLNRYSILAPKGKPFKYTITNGSIQPVVSDVEGMKLYRWESTNVPAVKAEPIMSALIDVVPLLSYSSIPDWKYVSHWYKDLTTSKFNSDYVLKATLASILKGHENDTQLAKAKLFYNYILQNISYSNIAFMHSNFVPQKASRTITTRLGDCKDVATLFVALCRESGIDANLVLISVRDIGLNQLILPSVNFNHCIAQLNVDGKTYYLELTDTKLPFGAALAADLKSRILPIPFKDEPIGDKLLSMDMPFRQPNSIQRYERISLNDNDMQIARHSASYAANASYLRDSYRDLGSEEQLKQISQAVASGFNVPVKVTGLSFSNLDNLSDSVTYDCNIEVKKVMQDVAGMKILSLPWTDKISSLEDVTLEKRDYPFELWAYQSEDINSEQLEIVLPQGMAFVETPKNIHLECANASFDLLFDTSKPGVVRGTRIFRRTSEQVTTAQYAAFRDFINRVSEADNKQFAIK
jgi:tetratricopeptide (TPR) repeat protein